MIPDGTKIKDSPIKTTSRQLFFKLIFGINFKNIKYDKISKKDIDKPGLEVALPGYINPNNPFEENYVAKENNPQ
jgi:hypothetical protein